MPKNQELRRLLVAAAAVSSLVALSILAGCAGAEPGTAGSAGAPDRAGTATETSTPDPTVAAHPTPDPAVHVQVGERVHREVSQATGRYLAATQQVLSAPGKPARRPVAVAGSAWNTVLAMRTEYAAKHYRVVGEPRVVAQHVVRRTGKPPTLVVAACLDSSNVRVLDRRGEPVPGSAGTDRSLNLITLEHRGGDWVVVATTFPDDPNC